MPYETERQYIWRLGSAKDNGFVDLSWDELAAILNRELRDDKRDYLDESAYRKSYTYAKKYYDDVFSKFAEDAYVKELKEAKRELEKERKKIQTEKIELNKWLRESARDEMIVEKITDAINNLQDVAPPDIVDKDDVDHDREWVLAFGDAHYGAEFEIVGLYGEVINKYSPEIFEERMEQLFNEVLNIIKREHIGDLYIFDLGDQIDGLLRIGQLVRLRYGVVESTIRYAEYMSQWLNKLSAHCKIHFRQCNGNHSELRLLDGKKGTFEEENMSTVIYHYIKMRLCNNPNVIVDQNPTGKIFETIAGCNVLAFHGESKDLEQTLKDFDSIYQTKIDILIAGHLHHAYSETVGVNVDVMRTPSIIGVDKFSLKINKASNAGATMFGIEKDKGKTLEYHIKLK